VDLADGSHFFTSATFWGPTVGAIVGVLTTAVLVWVTLKAASPKRRLYCEMPVVTPLLRKRPDLPQDIEVRRGGEVLADPHVVNVELTSRGRLDIAREAFDGGEPLRLDVGAPIVECLNVTTSPSDRPDPAWNTDSSAFLIGPSHIGKRQTSVFSLLVDGPSPNLSKPRQSLIDVDIRLRGPVPAPTRQQRLALTTTIVALAFLGLLLQGVFHTEVAEVVAVILLFIAGMVSGILIPWVIVLIPWVIIGARQPDR
jgi:hypothetical protein